MTYNSGGRSGSAAEILPVQRSIEEWDNPRTLNISGKPGYVPHLFTHNLETNMATESEELSASLDHLDRWLNANHPSAAGYSNAVEAHRLLTDLRAADNPHRRAYVAERLKRF